MAGSAARSSITSGISAVKQPASKKSANAKPKPAERLVRNLFAELARIAEMSAVERRLRDSGFRAIAGTDEVGRGCLAGPVVAACVILDSEPCLVGVTIDMDLPQVPLIGGDRRSVSIAAASIVAKVYRDLLMESYHDLYPVYDFRHNRGYATEGHQAALKLYGPSPIHRRSFEGVDEPMLLFVRNGADGDPTR